MQFCNNFDERLEAQQKMRRGGKELEKTFLDWSCTGVCSCSKNKKGMHDC